MLFLLTILYYLPVIASNGLALLGAGVEQPLGPIVLVLSALSMWSGIWGFLGDDSLLVWLPFVVAGSVSIVRNCTQLEPQDYIAKGNAITEHDGSHA